jgi:hypothetical protein
MERAFSRSLAGASFLPLLVITKPNWEVTGDAERTQDRQTDRKLGPGLLSAQVETHNPHCFFSLLFSSSTLLLSIFIL